MKQITDITPQKNDKKRVNLFIDGTFYSGVERIVLLTENLHIGDFIDEEKLSAVISESEYTSAFSRASSYLLKGSHTVKQVAGYLVKKGYSGKIAAEVIDKLQSYGYLDDGQFAENYVDLKSSRHGKRLLEVELKQKGVKEEYIEKALSNIENEDETALSIAKKYVKDKPLDMKMKQKCFRYILSKGFSYESAKYALDTLSSGDTDF